jgi:formiminotetrahydrofolate cyclodeaminase
MGAALIAKTVRLTIGREKFARVAKEMLRIEEEASELRDRLLRLADLDLLVYAPVIEAKRLPKDDLTREARLENSLTRAAEVSSEICGASARVAVLARRAAGIGNPLLKPDATSGADLAAGAVRGCYLQALENLKGIKDRDVRKTLQARLAKFAEV